MLAEAGGGPAAASTPRAAADSTPRAGVATRAVAVIVALEVERRCLGRCGGDVRIRVSGPGAARAAEAADAAVAGGAVAIVSFGLAGGLAADVAPGMLMLPRRILTADGRHIDVDAPWRERIAAALAGEIALDQRPLLAAERVVETTAEKASAAESGAAAVDLESGALAAAAARARLPFVALRAVADGPRDALPPGVETWVDAAGRPLLAPVIDFARRPSSWPALWTLARRYGAARRTLRRAASRLRERSFLIE